MADIRDQLVELSINSLGEYQLLEEKLVTENSLLRQLKFGRDLPGGGDSKEPFVNRNTLPGVLEQNPNLGLLGGNTDFLLRAGTLQRSAEDVSRMSQLLLTTGKGLLFTAKQNLLSRTNVKTQAKTIGLNQGAYLPTSTIAQIATSGLGFHLNKQGLNPFANTGLRAGEDGSGGNVLEGIASLTKVPTYLSANIKGGDSGNTNRLVQLTEFKLVGQTSGLQGALQGVTGFLSRVAGGIDTIIGTDLKSKVNDLIPNIDTRLAINNISNARDEILAYGGGPGSEIGVGRTRIKRYQFSDQYNTESFKKQYYLLDNGQIQELSNEAVNSKGKIRQDFRQFLLEQQNKGDKKDIISNSLDYERDNIEQRVGLGNPGTSQKNLTSYVNGTGNGPIDKVNSLPLYSSKGVTQNGRKNDLVKFRIAAINPHDDFNKTYIHFRAFLENFDDSYTSNWDEFKYMGRTESFYKYQGFTRSISLGWKLAAQSREELIIMYKKLNYLQSIMTGDYSPNGFMEGNLVDLTVGGYFWEQPGFFTALNITFPENSPYEIGIPDGTDRTTGFSNFLTDKEVREIPMYLDITANFIPIQKFAPRKQQNKFTNGILDSYGSERYINLANEGGKTSYDRVGNSDKFDPFSNTTKQQGTPSTEQNTSVLDQGQIDNPSIGTNDNSCSNGLI